jgi:hypothetical protein
MEAIAVGDGFNYSGMDEANRALLNIRGGGAGA